MKSKKFKVGNLVEHDPSSWKHLGIVVDTGIDFPPFTLPGGALAENNRKRSEYVNIHWTSGKTHRIYKGFGDHYDKLKVVAK